VNDETLNENTEQIDTPMDRLKEMEGYNKLSQTAVGKSQDGKKRR
jgi:hypothetical protein